MENRTIKASEFKAKCLKLMDEIAATGETVTITKNGKPIVEVRPATRQRRTLRGLHKGLGETRGDIVGPIFEDDWESLR